MITRQQIENVWGKQQTLVKCKWIFLDRNREEYVHQVGHILSGVQVDLIGISAGFDNHIDDWGGLLETEDYFSIGTMVRQTARASGGGCFAILEGGYNHDVLGHNVAALIEGLSS